MTFEEEFPSFVGVKKGPFVAKDLIPVWAIKSRCLDKQRVREALAKFRETVFDCAGDDAYVYLDMIDELRQELGLDD